MRLPRGWRKGHQGDVACPHRDCSCCPECAKRIEVVEVYGAHFWVPDADERAVLIAGMAEAGASQGA